MKKYERSGNVTMMAQNAKNVSKDINAIRNEWKHVLILWNKM